MTVKSPFYFEANKLWVEKETWTDLIGEESAVAVYSLKAAAAEIIEHGGAFIINDDNIGIIKRCDRLHDLDALMGDVNAYRLEKGLQTL